MKKINPSYTNSWWDYYGISAWNESKASEYFQEDDGVMKKFCDQCGVEEEEHKEDQQYAEKEDKHEFEHDPDGLVMESKASEWTPSQGHDWQPPTDKDYKDLPKPDKNQKMAGSHDEPKYNRDTDGKFSKETEYEEAPSDTSLAKSSKLISGTVTVRSP